MTSITTSPSAAVSGIAKAKYNYALGYLRAFIVMLVVAHHSVLAYYPYAPPPPASLVAQPRWWQAFPVVDAHKWSESSLFLFFNDVFFMSLMFFLSGLFVWHGLARKGSGSFVRDRLLRLGLPFLVAAAILAPLAYYPTYLQIADHRGRRSEGHCPARSSRPSYNGISLPETPAREVSGLTGFRVYTFAPCGATVQAKGIKLAETVE